MTGGHKKTPQQYTTEVSATENDLPDAVMDCVQAGEISSKGVRGLAASLHISERHLRRIVQEKTGTSPLHFNDTKRLEIARRLVLQTTLPIIDIAFMSEFSSLRQFNDVFKLTFKTSPSEMRKNATAK